MSHAPSGPVSVRFDGDPERVKELLPAAQQLLARVRAFTQTAEVSTFSGHMNPTPDSYVYALVAGEQQIIYISAESAPAPEPEVWPTSDITPEIDIMSGAVFSGVLNTVKYKDARGEEQERLEIESWSPTRQYAAFAEIPYRAQPSARLAVRYDATQFPEWGPPPKSQLQFSQYHKSRSSMYTGLMGKAVQAIMGLGRIDPLILAKTDEEKQTPTDYMKRVAANGVQVLYDYKFNRTHGITRGADGRMWLIEISSGKGVVAIPLPYIPTTDTPEFIGKARESKNLALGPIVNALGGIPSGEPMPSNAEIERRILEGTALRLATPEQLADFYKLSGFSTVCGWSFNSTGTSAVNVGFTYDDDHPYQRSQCWLMTIRIGPVNRNWKPGTPMASGSASLLLRSEGRLFSRKQGIPVKYYEPGIDGLLTHIALPQRLPGVTQLPLLRMNAPVFAAWINDELKMGWFFNDQRPDNTFQSTDDRIGEHCFLSGSWSWEYRTGSTTLPPMVWTNDYDYRAIASDYVRTGNLVATPKAWGSPKLGHSIEHPEFGSLSVAKYFTRVTEESEGRFESRAAVLIVPGGVRAGYCFYEGHWFDDGFRTTKSADFTNVIGTHRASTWRQLYPGRIGGNDGLYLAPQATLACGGKHHDDKVVETWDEPAVGCSAYAEGGPLPGLCATVTHINKTGGQEPRYPQYSRTIDNGKKFEGTVKVQLDTLTGSFSEPIQYNDMSYALIQSPSELGSIQDMQWSYSTLGHRVTYSMGFLEARTEGPTPFVVPAKARAPHYIGVII